MAIYQGGIPTATARTLLQNLAPHAWGPGTGQTFPNGVGSQSWMNQYPGGRQIIQEGPAPGFPSGSPIPSTGATGLNVAAMFGMSGLPQELIDQMNAELGSGLDLATAQTLAYNTILSSDWFAQTYPGYFDGLSTNRWSSPKEYKGMVLDYNALSQQWTDTPLSTGDFLSMVNQGISVQDYAKILAGAAWTQANTPDVQTEFGAYDTGPLSGRELTKLGQTEVGYGSNLGVALQKRMQDAQNRMARIFQGVAASPTLTGKTSGTGLQAPSLGGGANQTPEVEGYRLGAVQSTQGTFGGL